MNRSLLLHVVERLEGLVGRLPSTIQKPILSELTPLKELFLKQRPPRFAFTGSFDTPLPQIMAAMFPGFVPAAPGGNTRRKEQWREYHLEDRGTISILDARDPEAAERIGEELGSVPADVIFFVEDDDRKKMRKQSMENLTGVIDQNRPGGPNAGVIGVIYGVSEETASKTLAERGSRLET